MAGYKFDIDTGGENYRAQTSVPTGRQTAEFDRRLAQLPDTSLISDPMAYTQDAMSRDNYGSLLTLLSSPDGLASLAGSRTSGQNQALQPIPGFSKGGPVSQAPKQPIGPSDTQPAMLDPEEFVLRPEATQALGMDALLLLNDLVPEQLPEQPAERLKWIGELLIELAQENTQGRDFQGGLTALKSDKMSRDG